MREIKFRLVKDNKVVGYEWHDAENYSDVTICHSEDGEEWFAIEYCVVERRFIEHDHKDQYTGLLDKNGTEIYEGDIIAQPNDQDAWETEDDDEAELLSKKGFSGERITVEYDDKLTRFLCHFWTIYGGEGYSGDVECQQLERYIKDGQMVIGNVHENPELLVKA